MITRSAPAKINLALHVTGQRQDGYHLLDSLVAFASVGDIVTVSEAPKLTLSVSGWFADDLAVGGDNLVLRAARLLSPGRGAAIGLRKNLPVAAGIGGGSADAAACLHALADLWQVPLPAAMKVLGLGADLPVCLDGRPSRLRGIGEGLEPVALPAFQAVLVNPGVALATPAAFRALKVRENPPLPDPPTSADAEQWLGYLNKARNDLEAAAVSLQPKVSLVLAFLRVMDGCRLARMSGSGATCFGLFDNADSARAAALRIRKLRPDWWVVDTSISGSGDPRHHIIGNPGQ
ncbi:MAG: 4-(cytidine 5'-diphospho)-2-C-methyl-D-erythritol kinase [Rhodobacteraceae bacterium]|nr:4-(cytidine 5'-diphospho)-2-C-methyl-D-erythritol kinase [Paracoccaceae bacterium]